MEKQELKEQHNLVGEIVKNHFSTYQEVKILEAGCGSGTHFELLSNYKLTGIDISKQQLDRNKNLSEKICGDIQTYPLESESVDMVICWYVLEHLKYPQKAMFNFNNALKKNGLIVLAMPNIWSVKGIVTKFTPTFVHIWFYRYVAKRKMAGKDDLGPFKTYLKTSISPNNIRQFAEEKNLEVLHFAYISEPLSSNLKQLNSTLYAVQMFVGAILWFFSFGKITKKNPEFIIILKK